MRLSLQPLPSISYFSGSGPSPAKYAESLREAEQAKAENNDLPSLETLDNNALVQHVSEGWERFENVPASPNEGPILRFDELNKDVKDLGSGKEIEVYRDGDGKLRGVAYLDKTMIGAKDFRIEEYFGPAGNIQEARYVGDDETVVAVTRFPSEISFNTTKVKKEPFKPLIDKLERAKKTWFALNNHWFTTQDEKKVQANLMELVDWTCLIIEQTALGTEEAFTGVVDKEGNTLTPTKAKEHFVEKLEALKKDLEDKTEEQKKTTGSSSSKWNHALNFITGLISMIAIWSVTPWVGVVGGVVVRAGSQSTLDRNTEIAQNKEFLKGWAELLVDVLEGEDFMSGVSGTPTISFTDAFHQLKSQNEELQKQNKNLLGEVQGLKESVAPLLNGARRHSTDALSVPENLEVNQLVRSSSAGPVNSSVSREELEEIVQATVRRTTEETIARLFEQGLLKLA